MQIKLPKYHCLDTRKMNIIKIITRAMREGAVRNRIINKTAPILDIGCNDGHFIKRYPNGIGIDKIYGQDVEYGLDFPDNSFYVVTMLAVIEHINNSAFVFNEIRRVLVPGGDLIITTPKHSSKRIIQLYAGKDEEAEHKRYYNKEDFYNITGFKVIEASDFGILNQIIVMEAK